MAQAFDNRIAEEGEPFEVGPFHIVPFEMVHIGVRAVGYRIVADGSILAYTGDTGPCDAAIELTRDADLFLCEATYQNSSTLMPFHLSAVQAAEIANQAGARRLLLTHVTPDLDPDVSRTEADAVFDGRVDVARTGFAVEVGT
jgi:ribonuclease BN (tRNA processing enzyme)